MEYENDVEYPICDSEESWMDYADEGEITGNDEDSHDPDFDFD